MGGRVLKSHKTGLWPLLSSYGGSFTVVGAFALAGWLLQLTVGAVPDGLLRFPVNAFVLGFIVVVCLGLPVLSWHRAFSWLSGLPLSMATMSGMAVLALILGLVPQVPVGAEGYSALGFDSLLRAWPFVLLYLLMTVNLTAVLVRRLRAFKWASYAFYLNHLGLWLMLVAAGFGAADKERYVMPVTEGTTEWRVYDKNDDLLELPLAITLIDFRMETYPAQFGMPPEPKFFESEVVVYTRDEQRLERFVSVNAPIRVGAWMIYQYGYEADKGKDATWSSFELVYDRWAPGTYLGLVLCVLGALCLLWQGSKTAKSRRHESVE
ncbi:MAG: cytochrome c biogenesis protein ResB [Bacteroidales bacterium]|jgi:hypothetical protein|nr:cytochrome c biogenesis protein ResB [Bacteroidales bacterium]